jgi:hypothetical protein
MVVVADVVPSLMRTVNQSERAEQFRSADATCKIGNAGLRLLPSGEVTIGLSCSNPGRRFSRIHAASPAGESDNPTARVCGSAMWAHSARCQSAAVIVRSVRFEQPQYSIGAGRRPHRDNATIGFTQSL